MSQEANIILCGGPINHSNVPIGATQANAMITVNGKPVIGWILDDLLSKGIHRATVVLREQDRRLQEFLQRAYSRRMDLVIASLLHEGTIVQSLGAGLERDPSDGLVRVILGDTLIRDSYHGQNDFVYVAPVEDSARWCLAVAAADGRVIDYLDKQHRVAEPRRALAGYYHLIHGDYLRRCVEKTVADGARELSDVLRRYGAVYPISTRAVGEWYDFGHIDNLFDARRRLLQPRYFNSLSINPVLNTITKISQYDEKLRDELNWFLSIPDDLKVLTPRILKHERMNGHLEVMQEYYGYPTLAELYVYGDLHADAWLSILRQVLRIHREFRQYPGELEPEAIEAMYVGKTWQRLDTLRRHDPFWDILLERDTITFNGRLLRNIGRLSDLLHIKARALTASAPVFVTHGDFCFSNILFDLHNRIIRLIDPRGSFGRKGIYGDARYDIAKLRHSVCGLYDYIIADMFELQENDAEFSGQIYVNGAPAMVGAAFDGMVREMGYDLEDIRFIEGLLFVSMLPLHKDHPARQRMMFVTGLSLLNDALVSN